MTRISIEEYLSTSYRPDCDFVDGEVQDRNVGLLSHSLTQRNLLLYFAHRQRLWNTVALLSQRVRISPTRIRAVDVCVTLGEPEEQTFVTPPFLCIEVLSPDDRMSRIVEKVDDYLAMGVPYVWVLDPWTKRAWEITATLGWRENRSGILKTENPSLDVPLSEIWA